jgi:NAD(P)-dependent dehydrogenase (short-subunit alcohol dehydrogenase family)
MVLQTIPKKYDLESLFSIKDKIVILTGATRGVGELTGAVFSQLGAKVVLASRSIKSITYLSHELFLVQVDVTRRNQIEELVEKTVEKYGRIDILINNAGVFIPSNPEDITEEDWDKTLDTNLKGAFFCSQAVGKVMMAQKEGKIINVSSVSGSRATPMPPSASYDASKGGLDNLTRALAIAWAKYNINVNGIAPCALETPMKIPLSAEEEKRKIEWIPMKRRGTPGDLIGAIVFLSSPASDFMTGHILAVDGGRSAW